MSEFYEKMNGVYIILESVDEPSRYLNANAVEYMHALNFNRKFKLTAPAVNASIPLNTTIFYINFPNFIPIGSVEKPCTKIIDGHIVCSSGVMTLNVSPGREGDYSTVTLCFTDDYSTCATQQNTWSDFANAQWRPIIINPAAFPAAYEQLFTSGKLDRAKYNKDGLDSLTAPPRVAKDAQDWTILMVAGALCFLLSALLIYEYQRRVNSPAPF